MTYRWKKTTLGLDLVGVHTPTVRSLKMAIWLMLKVVRAGSAWKGGHFSGPTTGSGRSNPWVLSFSLSATALSSIQGQILALSLTGQM